MIGVDEIFFILVLFFVIFFLMLIDVDHEDVHEPYVLVIVIIMIPNNQYQFLFHYQFLI
jgi:hypothetical protein